ncbi:MAG: DUF4145 domain-containing protein [Rhodospirillaceae bacterium]|nr:DUF4145 domain-containing protein [Rhodospirillaceae bacterium]
MKKKSAPKSAGSSATPQELIIQHIGLAIECAKTAKRHNKSLNGSNHYADKLANLRADATNAFGRLSGGTVGDTSALAEMMQKVFAGDVAAKDRSQAARDLQFALKTTWAEVKPDAVKLEDGGIFPLVALNQTKRAYLVAVGRQMNGSYTSGWHDASAVMMRRLLESVIIEAFEARGIDSKIKDGNGNFFQLTALINAALAETTWNLPRNVQKGITSLRDLGHTSAHSRYFLAKQLYIDELKAVYRETIEAFLHIARLL